MKKLKNYALSTLIYGTLVWVIMGVTCDIYLICVDFVNPKKADEISKKIME